MKLTDLKKDLKYADLIKDSSTRWLARANAMAIFRSMPFEVEKLDKLNLNFVEMVRQRVEEIIKLDSDNECTTNILFSWMFAVGNSQLVILKDSALELVTIRIQEVAAYLACHNIRILWFPRLTYKQVYTMTDELVGPIFSLADIATLDVAWEDTKVEEPGLIQLGEPKHEYPFELLKHLTSIGDVEGIVQEVLRLTSSSIEYVTVDDLTKALINAWEFGGK